MNAWLDPFVNWLADLYLLSSCLLLVGLISLRQLKQPAARMAVARSIAVGLAILALVAATPRWPRTGWPRSLDDDAPQMQKLSAIDIRDRSESDALGFRAADCGRTSGFRRKLNFDSRRRIRENGRAPRMRRDLGIGLPDRGGIEPGVACSGCGPGGSAAPIGAAGDIAASEPACSRRRRTAMWGKRVLEYMDRSAGGDRSDAADDCPAGGFRGTGA